MDQIREAYLRLSDREKKLVLILGIALLVISFALGGYFGVYSGFKRASAIKQMRQRIADVYRLEQPYVNAQSTLDDLTRRLDSNKISLFSLVEDVSSKLGVQIDNVTEKSEHVDNSELDEISVLVHLKELSIDRLTAFLEGIEETAENGLVKVMRLDIKTRYDNPGLLDAQMTIATWKHS